MRITKELFQVVPDEETAKKLFKENVDTVELGISSYCNRTCSYCPNSFVDRKSAEIQMSDELFDNVMHQLKKIDYAETITIHRYNEPFSDFSYALRRIEAIKDLLPNSKLVISTNGDYLTRERLLLVVNSLTARDSLHITLHFASQDRDYEEKKNELKKRVENLGFNHSEYTESPLKTSTWLDFGQKCRIEYRVINFFAGFSTSMITDRGETLNELKVITRRVRPCFTTVTQMQIDFDGSLQPCCNIHSSVAAHSKYSMGRLDSSSSIFLVYCSSKYVQWRKSMISFQEKDAPCQSCTDSTPQDGPETMKNRLRIALMRRKVGL